MTYRPEVTEPLTETQQLEDDLTRATRRISALWPDANPTLIPGRRISGGPRGGGLIAKDDDDTDADIDPVTRVMSIRRYAIDILSGWTRIVMEDRPVTNPKSIPRAHDVEGMCQFLEIHAQWFSGHDDAPDALDELRKVTQQLSTVQPPKMTQDEYLKSRPAQRWFIGRCPLAKPTNDAQPQPEGDEPAICDGQVYAYPDEEGERETTDIYTSSRDPWAICDKCKTKAVASHWEHSIFPNKSAEKYMDRTIGIDDVIQLAASEFGRHISKQTVWQWVSRNKLTPVDRNAKPHKFRFSEVIDTLTAREAG